VFLNIPNETRYDLRWRMLGTQVRVHPLFWLMSLILGFDAYIGAGVPYLFLWVACVFVSVLLHEFGHVLVGRLFGSDGFIVLYSFGGVAIGSNELDRRWQRVLVLLAGPCIQLALYALLRFTLPYYFFRIPPHLLKPVLLANLMLMNINLYWALLNLLPIWPLDGGQICREVFQAGMPGRGTAVSLGISMVVSGLLAVHELMASKGRPLINFPISDSDPSFVRQLKGMFQGGDMFMAMFFAMFFATSLMALQAENQRRSQWSDDEWT
jgi:stage IV sporulation protein FB